MMLCSSAPILHQQSIISHWDWWTPTPPFHFFCFFRLLELCGRWDFVSCLSVCKSTSVFSIALIPVFLILRRLTSESHRMCFVLFVCINRVGGEARKTIVNYTRSLNPHKVC